MFSILLDNDPCFSLKVLTGEKLHLSNILSLQLLQTINYGQKTIPLGSHCPVTAYFTVVLIYS